MASTFEVKTIDSIEVPGTDSIQLWSELADGPKSQHDKFESLYPGVRWMFGNYEDTVTYVGPRDSLLALKYDFEKKRYG